MKLLAVLGLLVGCSGKDPCPAARKTATDAVERAQTSARTEVEVLQNAADEAPQRTQLELTRIELDEKLEALEAAMDCLDHDDCCERLSKIPDHAPISAIAREIMAVTPMPPAILELLAPSSKTLDKDGVSAAWCTQVRQEIIRVRVSGLDEWRKMEDAADVQSDSNDASIAAVQKRVAALETWEQALRAKKRPSPAPDPSLLDDARPAVEAYLTTCK